MKITTYKTFNKYTLYKFNRNIATNIKNYSF